MCLSISLTYKEPASAFNAASKAVCKQILLKKKTKLETWRSKRWETGYDPHPMKFWGWASCMGSLEWVSSSVECFQYREAHYLQQQCRLWLDISPSTCDLISSLTLSWRWHIFFFSWVPSPASSSHSSSSGQQIYIVLVKASFSPEAAVRLEVDRHRPAQRYSEPTAIGNRLLLVE